MLEINILKRANLPLYCAEGGRGEGGNYRVEDCGASYYNDWSILFLNYGKSKTGKYTKTRED